RVAGDGAMAGEPFEPLACRGPGYVSKGGAAKVAIAGAAKMTIPGAAKLSTARQAGRVPQMLGGRPSPDVHVETGYGSIAGARSAAPDGDRAVRGGQAARPESHDRAAVPDRAGGGGGAVRGRPAGSPRGSA